jgi:hypothetical protein
MRVCLQETFVIVKYMYIDNTRISVVHRVFRFGKFGENKPTCNLNESIQFALNWMFHMIRWNHIHRISKYIHVVGRMETYPLSYDLRLVHGTNTMHTSTRYSDTTGVLVYLFSKLRKMLPKMEVYKSSNVWRAPQPTNRHTLPITRRFRNFGSCMCLVPFTQNIYQNFVRRTPK